jgi:putative ABC transport system permease protein
MNPLDLKLFRDLWHLRGQVIAIALVVACGIASFVMARSAYTSLTLTQTTYYNQYHFAQLFASLKRAPETLKDQIADIPGVAQTQTRIVVDVTPKEKLDKIGQPSLVLGLELLIFRSWQAKRATY